MLDSLWISVTTIGGTTVPVRVGDIDRVYLNNTGSKITWRNGGEPLVVTEAPSAVYAKLDALRTEYNSALSQNTV